MDKIKLLKGESLENFRLFLENEEEIFPYKSLISCDVLPLSENTVKKFIESSNLDGMERYFTAFVNGEELLVTKLPNKLIVGDEVYRAGKKIYRDEKVNVSLDSNLLEIIGPNGAMKNSLLTEINKGLFKEIKDSFNYIQLTLRYCKGKSDVKTVQGSLVRIDNLTSETPIVEITENNSVLAKAVLVNNSIQIVFTSEEFVVVIDRLSAK